MAKAEKKTVSIIRINVCGFVEYLHIEDSQRRNTFHKALGWMIRMHRRKTP